MSADKVYEHRERRVAVYLNPKCDRCKTPLTEVWPESGHEFESRQYNDASRVVMNGYYGGFVDLRKCDYDLCGDCSMALLGFMASGEATP